jgi:hypothetical protein
MKFDAFDFFVAAFAVVMLVFGVPFFCCAVFCAIAHGVAFFLPE